MKATRIKIANIAGVESLEFKPGHITRISGANEAGKTSVLNAIKSLIGGGSDAKLLRRGQKQGEVVILLEDNGHKYQARKSFTPRGGSLSIRDENGVTVGSPKAFLETIWDGISANPIEFVTANQKKRLALLLEAIPTKIDSDHLRKIVGGAVDLVHPGANTFEFLGTLSKQIYDARTDVNRSVDHDRDTLETIGADLPTGDLPDYSAEIDAIENEKQRLAEAHYKKVDEIRSASDKLKEEARRKHENAMEGIQGKQQGAIEKATKEIQPKLSELSEKAAALKRDSEAAIAAKGRIKLCEELRERAAKNDEQSRNMTAQLEALESERAKLLEKVPIPGVEIREGDIYVKGVPFESLSTSQRMKIAVQVAKLRAGKVPLICVDGMESLDEDNFQAFENAAKLSGLQFIVTRVGHGELSVTTDEDEEDANA